ncbi:MAG: ATP-dependent 6-phosphofructokinase [Candidatus Eisenbacteria bacterium]
MRVGILTGGGDCPGLNAVLRGFVLRHARERGGEVVGFERGWKGLLEGRVRALGPADVADQWNVGGTLLGTSRTNPLKQDDGLDRIRATWQAQRLDALVAIGGDDTLGVATRLAAAGLDVVGVPKTIDNDLSGTDYTFGFDTAINICAEALDRLHTTARSHGRVIVCEVMGRQAGWIGAYAGLAGGAHVTLVPEFPIDLASVCATVRQRREQGPGYTIIVVSEGAALPGLPGEVTVSQEKDAFGHARLGGIGERLAARIEAEVGGEVRSVVLGHIQRGGAPSAYDRVLATRFGVRAADLVAERQFGVMVALRGTALVAIPLAEATGTLKQVPASFYDMIQGVSG